MQGLTLRPLILSLGVRDNGTIGDAAFQQVEQELDIKELDLL